MQKEATASGHAILVWRSVTGCSGEEVPATPSGGGHHRQRLIRWRGSPRWAKQNCQQDDDPGDQTTTTTRSRVRMMEAARP